jgi:hypothetical protein
VGGTAFLLIKALHAKYLDGAIGINLKSRFGQRQPVVILANRDLSPETDIGGTIVASRAATESQRLLL